MKVGDLVRIRQVYGRFTIVGGTLSMSNLRPCDAVGVIVETSLNGALRVLFQDGQRPDFLWQYQVELVSESW